MSDTTTNVRPNAELDTVMAAAAAAAPALAATSPSERAGWLRAIADALDADSSVLVPLAMRESHLLEARLTGALVRTTFQLRDKAVLKFDRDAVERVELARPDGHVELARTSNEWRITEPLSVRADFGTAESIVGRLSTAQMKAIVSSEEPGGADLRKMGFDRPAVTATAAFCGLRPVANAFGCASSIRNTRGIGSPALSASRRTMP